MSALKVKCPDCDDPVWVRRGKIVPHETIYPIRWCAGGNQPAPAKPKRTDPPTKTAPLILRRAANLISDGSVSPPNCLLIASNLESVVDWLRGAAKIGGTPGRPA